MQSRKPPQHVLGSSQQQTSARPQTSLPQFLRLRNGTSSQRQAVSVKLTDDCFQQLQKAAQNNYEVLVHVNQKGIAIEIKTSSTSSLKFECYFERVSGTVFHALQKKENTYCDIASISIRANVKPTEQTLHSSMKKAQIVSRNLERENSKCRTQMLPDPLNPGDRTNAFKNRTIGNRVPSSQKSISNPLSGSLSGLRPASGSSTTFSKQPPPPKTKSIPSSPKDCSLEERVIHYIVSGRFQDQDGIVDLILVEGMAVYTLPETIKRKVREIICEVAEVSPNKITLLPKYFDKVNRNWPFFTAADRINVDNALSQTEVSPSSDFAPTRANRRGPMVAPRSRRRDPATPTMTNSTTTSPDLASDISSCSTPSPTDQTQCQAGTEHHENVRSKEHSKERSKAKLTDTFKPGSSQPLVTADDCPPPSKVRCVADPTSNRHRNEPIKVIAVPAREPEPLDRPSSSQSRKHPRNRSQEGKDGIKSEVADKNSHRHRDSNVKSEKESANISRVSENSALSIKASPRDVRTTNECKLASGSSITGVATHKKSERPQKPFKDEFSKKNKKEKPKPTDVAKERSQLSEKAQETLMELAAESMRRMKAEKQEKEKVAKELMKEKSIKKEVSDAPVVEKRDKKEKSEKSSEQRAKEKEERRERKQRERREQELREMERIDQVLATTAPREDREKSKSEKASEKLEKVSGKPEKVSEKPEKVSEKSVKAAEKSEKASEKPRSEKSKEERRKEKAERRKEKELERERERNKDSANSESGRPEKKKDKNRSLKTADTSATTKKQATPSSTISSVVEEPASKPVIPSVAKEEKRKAQESHPTAEKKESDRAKSKTEQHGRPTAILNVSQSATLKAKEKLAEVHPVKPTMVVTPEPPKEKSVEKLRIQATEKLSKPIIRDPPPNPPVVRKQLNPEKITAEELKTATVKELLDLLSCSLKPSKNYEEKYPAIRNITEAKVYTDHELEYYDLYEKAYNNLKIVQNDLEIYVDRMNNARSNAERHMLEEKIRTYAARCLQDHSFRHHRRTVANMTNAIQVLRNRMDQFYGPNGQPNH